MKIALYWAQVPVARSVHRERRLKFGA